jgi:hypothetical protein
MRFCSLYISDNQARTRPGWRLVDTVGLCLLTGMRAALTAPANHPETTHQGHRDALSVRVSAAATLDSVRMDGADNSDERVFVVLGLSQSLLALQLQHVPDCSWSP